VVRVRIAVVFGLFEAGMPVLGLVLGRGVDGGLGRSAHWLGGAVLVVVGVIGLVLARRGHEAGTPGSPDRPGGPQASGAAGVPAGRGASGTGRVLVSAAALSVDNLAAGFALGAYRTGLAVAATVFGVVSVIMALAGLELGAKIGAAAGDRSELIACAMLVAVGAAVAAGAF
jgi:manganese efflux pump family protein